MKKFASLLMAVLMLCALCVPASAAQKEITVNQTATYVSSDRIISIAGEYETESLAITPGSKLTIGAGVTLKVTDSFINTGAIELLGTLDLSQCSSDISNMSINIGLTGELIYDPEVITFNNITGPGRIINTRETNDMSDDTDSNPASDPEYLNVKEDTVISGDHTYFLVDVFGFEVDDFYIPCNLTVESGAAVTCDGNFSLKNGCSATIKSDAAVTCNEFRVEDGSTVTIESGASVTCGLFKLDEGCTVTIESDASVTCDQFWLEDGSSVTIGSGASLTCSGSLIINLGSTATVKNGASVTCEELRVTGSDEKDSVMVLENGASISVNGDVEVDVRSNSSLDISGILTGKCTRFTGNVTLSPGGTVDLEAANDNVANKLVAELKQYEEGAKAEQNSDGSYRVTAHRHIFAEEGICCGEEYLKNIASGDTASTLSEGSLAIVCTVAGVAVGLVGGLLLGKKKKTSNS